MKKRTVFVLVLLLGLAAGGLFAIAQESITLTTYYPSPKGVYDELRANTLSLKDGETGDIYSLTMKGGKLIITDMARKRGFIVIDFNQPQPSR
jgi:hypothetical protein